MARGFDSKSVTDQQESAFDDRPVRGPALVDPGRRRLELARMDVAHRLDEATTPAHREMLKRALTALDKDLRV